ncbi:MAG TPA: lytic transglycosylase domain-containing protein [Xanthobacteraceae bacterium]|nr:lytic transglycosylase domain-containing protein [Xanthobacteraceae bacterium]
MDAPIDIAARISGATTDIATRVTGAIRDAARATGAGFEYLLNTAIRESNLNPNAKAKTSSATGLFQFIDQTWLGTIKQSGKALGYGKYADAITRTPQGKFVVDDPAMRREIMALRKEPTANAVMAGAFANSNAKVLNDRLGRKPTDGELYMAHFLGASGAARFIKAAEARPDAKAANYFPRAAQANASIFYDKQGGARSLKQVYAGLVARHDGIGPTRFAGVTPAAKAATAAAVKPVAPLAFARDVPAAPGNATAVAPVSATAAVTAINAATASAPVPSSPVPLVAETQAVVGRPQPLFESLYQPPEQGPVGPVVRELWGRRITAVETPNAVAPAAESAASGKANVNAPLDLFQFLRPTVRRPA